MAKTLEDFRKAVQKLDITDYQKVDAFLHLFPDPDQIFPGDAEEFQRNSANLTVKEFSADLLKKLSEMEVYYRGLYADLLTKYLGRMLSFNEYIHLRDKSPNKINFDPSNQWNKLAADAEEDLKDQVQRGKNFVHRLIQSQATFSRAYATQVDAAQPPRLDDFDTNTSRSIEALINYLKTYIALTSKMQDQEFARRSSFVTVILNFEEVINLLSTKNFKANDFITLVNSLETKLKGRKPSPLPPLLKKQISDTQHELITSAGYRFSSIEAKDLIAEHAQIRAMFNSFDTNINEFVRLTNQIRQENFGEISDFLHRRGLTPEKKLNTSQLKQRELLTTLFYQLAPQLLKIQKLLLFYACLAKENKADLSSYSLLLNQFNILIALIFEEKTSVFALQQHINILQNQSGKNTNLPLPIRNLFNDINKTLAPFIKGKLTDLVQDQQIKEEISSFGTALQKCSTPQPNSILATDEVIESLTVVKKAIEQETQEQIKNKGTLQNTAYPSLIQHFARLTSLVNSDISKGTNLEKINSEITAIQNICDGKGTTKVTYTEYVPPITSSLKETITSALTVIATAVFFAAVGAAIGFLVGGPIGAGAGATVGVHHALIGGTIGVSAYGLFKTVHSFFAPYELTDPIVTNVNQKIGAPPKGLKETVTASLEQVKSQLETTASRTSTAPPSRRGSLGVDEEETPSPRLSRSSSYSD